jgi:hypothetical protein
MFTQIFIQLHSPYYNNYPCLCINISSGIFVVFVFGFVIFGFILYLYSP